MTRKVSYIPNPNKISNSELDFLKHSSSNFPDQSFKHISSLQTDKYKGRMISMSDSFYKELNDYLHLNPTEGNRSSFIVRVVANYIKNKNERL